MTLKDVYAKVPKIACKGLCHESCGWIACGKKEADAMQAAHGDRLTFVRGVNRCGYLVENRCAVYAQRPLVCRLWGVVPELPCPHGCETERVLTRVEARVLFQTMQRLGGPAVVADVVDTAGEV